jgi:phage/plasmid-associated DNA primase
LLADPDPIEPQIKSVTDKLRNAITILSDQFNSEYQLLKDQLEENANWQKLTLPQQQLILDNCEINEPDAIAVNTVDELIDNLEACSIKHWNDRIQAQSNKFNSASMDAAKLLEPKVQIIKLPHRTLKTEADIKDWLAEVEQQMLKDLQNGPLVV